MVDRDTTRADVCAMLMRKAANRGEDATALVLSLVACAQQSDGVEYYQEIRQVGAAESPLEALRLAMPDIAGGKSGGGGGKGGQATPGGQEGEADITVKLFSHPDTGGPPPVATVSITEDRLLGELQLRSVMAGGLEKKCRTGVDQWRQRFFVLERASTRLWYCKTQRIDKNLTYVCGCGCACVCVWGGGGGGGCMVLWCPCVGVIWGYIISISLYLTHTLFSSTRGGCA